jgi:PKD repeat protein
MSIRRSRYRCLFRAYLVRPVMLALGLLALTGGAFAGSVNLAWDAVSGASGYRVSYGTTPANYTAKLDAGSNTSATVAGLTDGTRYYFAVQAYAGTVTSSYSNEVSTIVAPATTAPAASFTANGSTASSLSVTQGQTVILVDTSTGTVASRSWALGDGTSATSTTVVKTYATTGAKTVTLSVTGAARTTTATKTINVTAATAAPVASFSASPVTGTAPLAVKFSDASSGSISSWSWSFGNGATSAAQSPTYTYASAGTYTVSLTVTGPGGSNTATKTNYVTVASNSSSGRSSGLVAAYGFDETNGTQVLDASGNGNHGTLSNVTRTTQAKFGRALYFSGSNSLVTVSDSSSLDLTTGMTLSAWVYPTTWASGWKSLLMKESSGGLAYALSANSAADQPDSTLRIGGYDRQLAAGSHLPSNTWTHLAATYDGTTQRLFVNGVQVGSRSQTGTLDVSANPLRVGGNTVWANEYFQGLIDEVRIYNRALTQSEIAAVSQEPVSQPAQKASLCATPCSLWSSTATPSVAAAADTSAVELGMKIRSDVDGLITGVRYYKGSQKTGTHVGRLWSSTGQLLAQATFANETASGWQEVSFATPVAIKPNTVYVVSYYAPVGRYAFDDGYFQTADTNGPLRALADGESGGNGVYRYGSGGGFPTSTYRSANYWVDVVFQTP